MLCQGIPKKTYLNVDVENDVASLDTKYNIDFKTGEITERAPCNNKFAQRNWLYNIRTGKKFRPSCQNYSCPRHGWRRKVRLQKALVKWLDSLGHIRFWTFSVSDRFVGSIYEHNELFKKSWHRFVVELRRDKSLPLAIRNLQYVKVYEYHQSRRLHIHAFFSEWVDKSIINRIWAYAVDRSYNLDEYYGKDFDRSKIKYSNAHVKGVRSALFGARYISKYVVKMSHEKKERIRSWSKSGRVGLFPKRKKSSDFVLFYSGSEKELFYSKWRPILVALNSGVTEISQLEELRKLSTIFN
ncbi:MAG: hypothetical protein ACE5EJ_00920, partial [Nitrosopumilaceae archaeon]